MVLSWEWAGLPFTMICNLLNTRHIGWDRGQMIDPNLNAFVTGWAGLCYTMTCSLLSLVVSCIPQTIERGILLFTQSLETGIRHYSRTMGPVLHPLYISDTMYRIKLTHGFVVLFSYGYIINQQLMRIIHLSWFCWLYVLLLFASYFKQCLLSV